MARSEGYSDALLRLVKALNSTGIRYALTGAAAVGYYGRDHRTLNLERTLALEPGVSQAPISTTPTPAGITILGVLMIIAGAFDLVQGAGLVGVTDPVEANLGPFNIPLGLVFIATGVGFLKNFGWAWTPGVVLSFLNLVRTFAVAAQDGIPVALPGIFVALLIIYYLFTPRVRAFFGRSTAS